MTTLPTFREVLSQAADAFNQLAPDLPPLMWSVYSTEIRGQVDPEADGAEAAEVLTAWAERFGLVLVDDYLSGAREYTGIRDEWQLIVWGVTDRAEWAEGTRRAVDAYWGWQG